MKFGLLSYCFAIIEKLKNYPLALSGGILLQPSPVVLLGNYYPRPLLSHPLLQKLKLLENGPNNVHLFYQKYPSKLS